MIQSTLRTHKSDYEYYRIQNPQSTPAPAGGSTLLRPNRNLFINIPVETEQEDDGRWIAEAPDLPGVMAYGTSKEKALANIRPLVLRVIAERLENNEHIPERILASVENV